VSIIHHIRMQPRYFSSLNLIPRVSNPMNGGPRNITLLFFFLQIDGSNEEKDFILKYTGQWWTWSMAKSAAPLYPHESHSRLYFRNSLNLLCAVATFDLLQSCNLANSDGLVLQVSTRRPGLDHLGHWMTLLGYKWSPTKEELLLEKHNNLLKSLFL
jgi:hypothetical protein